MIETRLMGALIALVAIGTLVSVGILAAVLGLRVAIWLLLLPCNLVLGLLSLAPGMLMKTLIGLSALELGLLFVPLIIAGVAFGSAMLTVAFTLLVLPALAVVLFFRLLEYAAPLSVPAS